MYSSCFSYFSYFFLINIFFISFLLSLLFIFNIWYKNFSHKLFLSYQYFLIFSYFIFFIIIYFNIYGYLYIYFTNYWLIINNSFEILNLNFFFTFFSWTFKFTPDIFGFILLLIAIFVGFVSFFTLDTRFFYKNLKFFSICHFLVISIYFFLFSSDLLIFFLFYEFLLFPSFLLVYFISPNRRGVQSSLYFLIWTQIGSIFVLLFIIYVYQFYGVYFFNDLKILCLQKKERWFLYFLLFFGFGFKVPIWPFHFWLTKTHVEAPTGFSIFLSGFLVKSAIYGFYKLALIIGPGLNTSFFSTIVALGILDSSFKMWGQSDLKKLVAYGTIQEMNIIYLSFCFGDSVFIFGGFLFCLTHALLSTLFFYFVDCIFRRYHTRSVTELQGILHLNPILGSVIFIGCIFYSGLPGTLKFLCEFYIFTGFIDFAPLTFFILLYSANVIGIIGFCKCWFNILFGLSLNLQKKATIDLTSREILIISFCFFLLMFLGFYLPWII